MLLFIRHLVELVCNIIVVPGRHFNKFIATVIDNIAKQFASVIGVKPETSDG